MRSALVVIDGRELKPGDTKIQSPGRLGGPSVLVWTFPHHHQMLNLPRSNRFAKSRCALRDDISSLVGAFSRRPLSAESHMHWLRVPTGRDLASLGI